MASSFVESIRIQFIVLATRCDEDFFQVINIAEINEKLV